MAQDISNVVWDARCLGMVLYRQYLRGNSDGSWYTQSDGTHIFPRELVTITPNGDVTGPYGKLRAFLKDHGLSGRRGRGEDYYEAAHLVPAEVCRLSGLSPNTAPAVMVSASLHMKELHGSTGLPSGTLYTSVDDMVAQHTIAYSSFGAWEWGEIAAKYVRENRDAFQRGLATNSGSRRAKYEANVNPANRQSRSSILQSRFIELAIANACLPTVSQSNVGESGLTKERDCAQQETIERNRRKKPHPGDASHRLCTLFSTDTRRSAAAKARFGQLPGSSH